MQIIKQTKEFNMNNISEETKEFAKDVYGHSVKFEPCEILDNLGNGSTESYENLCKAIAELINGPALNDVTEFRNAVIEHMPKLYEQKCVNCLPDQIDNQIW